MLAMPCPARQLGLVEADAVVGDEDDAPSGALRDRHLRVTRTRVPSGVAQPFLDDAEDLDLLVGREPGTLGSTSTSTSSAPSAVKHVDVPAESRVEARRAAGGRQRENREARLLLRRDGRALEPGEHFLERRVRLEHAHLGRDREQVLGEPVVDLARDARSLVRDRAAELRLADRPPDADDEDPVREDAQEVALEDEVARHDGRQDEVQIGEDGEGGSEAHPAVEVASVAAIAKAEADERDQPEDGEKRRCESHVGPFDDLVARRHGAAGHAGPELADRQEHRRRRRRPQPALDAAPPGGRSRTARPR